MILPVGGKTGKIAATQRGEDLGSCAGLRSGGFASRMLGFFAKNSKETLIVTLRNQEPPFIVKKDKKTPTDVKKFEETIFVAKRIKDTLGVAKKTKNTLKIEGGSGEGQQEETSGDFLTAQETLTIRRKKKKAGRPSITDNINFRRNHNTNGGGICIESIEILPPPGQLQERVFWRRFLL